MAGNPQTPVTVSLSRGGRFTTLAQFLQIMKQQNNFCFNPFLQGSGTGRGIKGAVTLSQKSVHQRCGHSNSPLGAPFSTSTVGSRGSDSLQSFLFPCFSANNFAMKGKRKTLNASDVLSAMEEMEFQRFVTPLKEALEGNDLFVFSAK